MGTPDPSGRIVVATSFPPQLVRMNAGRRIEEYDQLCVQSWIACGFKIISLNDAEEIPALASRHPEVAFIPTERNASEVFGRKTPFIADLLAALANESSDVLGIINSDILFEPAAAWRDMEELVAQRCVVTGQRCDTKSLAGGALHRYFPGFDYFFFDKAAAVDLAREKRPFSIGLPWWDYWLPIILRMRGYDIRCVARPVTLHLAHEFGPTTRSAAWRRLAVEFALAVISELESSPTSLPQSEELRGPCRELAQASEASVDSAGLDERIAQLCALCVPAITSNMLELDDGAVSASTNPPPALPGTAPFAVSIFFDEIAKRIAGGEALHKAVWHDG